MTSDEDRNAAEYQWEGDRIARWLAQAQGLHRQLQPAADLLFGAAALQDGETVLDVGCGDGPTTRHAAGLVGPNGEVTGIDVSAGMLHTAAEAELPSGSAPITWTVADVVAWQPPANQFDAVISRFGVMFFSDPIAAFRNLATSLKPGGRLVMVTWAERDRNQIFEMPYQVACAVARAHSLVPPEVPPAEGPYSLPNPDTNRALLNAAGLAEVEVARHDVMMPLGGGVDATTAALRSQELGPVRLVLSIYPQLRSPVSQALADAFEEHLDGKGRVSLAAELIVTSARKPLN